MEILNILPPAPNLKLRVHSLSKTHYIPLSQIVYCKADRNYASIFLDNGEEIVSSYSLAHLRRKLCTHGFFDVHKAYLVSLSHITCLVNNGENKIVLKNKKTIPVSRRKKSLLQQELDKKVNR